MRLHRSSSARVAALCCAVITLLLLTSAVSAGAKSKKRKARASAAVTVTITTPASRAKVSGLVAFKATAQSSYTMRSVRFYIDNSLRTTDTTAPYSYSSNGVAAIDTTKLSNGWHRLKVVATAAGNRTDTKSLLVQVDNAVVPPPPPPEPTPPAPEPTPPVPPPGSGPDTTPPTAPSGLSATGITSVSALLSWNASTDSSGIAVYDIHRNGVEVDWTHDTSRTVALTCGNTASFTVVAFDRAGNASTSAPLNITAAACGDGSAPSAPGSPTATDITQTTATLNWSASTDNVGVVRYDVFRSGVKLGSTAATTYAVPLSCGQSSSFSIVAFDASGNASPTSPVVVTALSCTSEPPPTGAQPLGVPGTWNQIWGDEFNGTTLDSSKWASLRGDAQWEYGSPFNPSIEDAFYKRDNVSVGGGNLAMTLKKETTNGYPYSSGMVHSGQDFGFRFGYIEARSYAPRCAGCWPAFWMLDLPLDDHWPPEIDIFEYFDSLADPMAYFNYHYVQNGNKQIGVKPYGEWQGDMSGWHTFGLHWTADKLQTYVDGQPGPSYANSTLITKATNYILFNFALEKGDAPPSGQQFLVDYVRVWQ